MNKDELNRMINNYAAQNGAAPDPKNQAKVEKLLSGLSDSQAQALKNLLSDPKKSQEILNSSAARALFKKLNNGK